MLPLAANIPEFVIVAPKAIQKIHEPIHNNSSYARAGYIFEWNGDVELALALARAAGNQGLAQEIEGRLAELRQKSGAR